MSPAYNIPRWSVVGMEGMWVKMWDPPTVSPATPDFIAPTNPVPEVLFAKGIANIAPTAPHTMMLDLLHSLTLATWDSPAPVGQAGAKVLNFYSIINPDIPATLNGIFPGTTVRMPCGVIFHCKTSGKGPPPHTIHWHGVEPTPINDGVGHCSMEIGDYTYQWQPSFVGSYFYHCHRNTMQHFEFGLYGLLLIEPADAYFATLADPSIPVGHCRDGKRRIGANLAPTAANPAGFPQFPGFNNNPREAADPWTGNPALKFLTDPHAQTVPYDVEALWVFDDRDSNWSINASNARATFPRHGSHPGYDDEFELNPGSNGFFAFNDYKADYWFVTGVPVPTPPGGIGTIPAGVMVPPELNSGIVGSQVSVEAYIGQTILIRCLDAAYNNCLYTFPVDIVIIAWDGRALGMPPYGFNESYLVPAGTPIEVSVGRRFDALIREFSPLNDFAICKFIDTRGANVAGFEVVTCTARVPMNISPLTVSVTPSVPSPHLTGSPVTFTAAMTGTPGSQAPTSGEYEYRFMLFDGTNWTMVQDYGNGNTWTLPANTPVGNYVIDVDIRSNPNVYRDANVYLNYEVTAGAATGVVITPSQPTPHLTGSSVNFVAAGQGSANYDYRFNLFDGTNWTLVQDYGNGDTWIMPAATAAGSYVVAVDVRTSSAVNRDTVAYLNYEVTAGPATGVVIIPNQPSPQAQGSDVIFTAVGQGSANYDYRFQLYDGTSWTLVQDYGNGDTWTLSGSASSGSYVVAVDVRTTSVVYRDTVAYLSYEITSSPATGVVVSPSQPTPHPQGTAVDFSATGQGSNNYDFRFWLFDGIIWTMVQDYGNGSVWTMAAATPAGDYVIGVDVRTSSAVYRDAVTYLSYTVQP